MCGSIQRDLPALEDGSKLPPARAGLISKPRKITVYDTGPDVLGQHGPRAPKEITGGYRTRMRCCMVAVQSRLAGIPLGHIRQKAPRHRMLLDLKTTSIQQHPKTGKSGYL